MTTALLDCPFCGSDTRRILKLHGDSQVCCTNCAASSARATSRELAIEAWNRRTEPSQGALTQEEKILEMYNSISEDIREDICKACEWAKNYLMRLEGEGHELYITRHSDRLVCCSFAKPEWRADHTSRGMDHGAQAVVMAVCEYVNGA